MASDDDIPLPASIEAAWGRRARPTKGPKPGLSLERIVDAAVAVAAAEGLDAVSMGRVAAELGSSPMSLYRYVAAKDELLALMIDAAVGAPPAGRRARAGARGCRDGRGRTTTCCAATRGRCGSRSARRAITPNVTAWLEHGLRCLGDTALPEAEKLSVMLLLSGYVRNEATLAADIGARRPEGGEIMPTWGRLLAQLTTPSDFPALHAALGSEAFAQDDEPDDEFVFGLERVLDGVAALVDARG